MIDGKNLEEINNENWIKMEEQKIILKDLFCTLCSLQFDKKYVFDVHLSIVHGQNIGVKTESEVWEENKTKVEEKYCSGNVVDRKFKCDISVPEVPALRLVEAAVGPGQCGSATPVDQVPRNV